MMKIIHGDCLEVMKDMEPDSIDSIVTDPPYGLSFMGKDWDHGVPGIRFWKEALRVAKPGAHLLAFGGTRTFHRLAVAIEDAGWVIRDTVGWIYGSGFPKSHNVGKAIDKKAGAERKVVGKSNINIYKEGKNHKFYVEGEGNPEYAKGDITAPATEAAKQWDGWGTALKPAVEFICMARKPFKGKTVAANVLEHGTGAINIDGCRVDFVDEADKGNPDRFKNAWSGPGSNEGWKRKAHKDYYTVPVGSKGGRWPANIIHDGSDEVLEVFPTSNQSSARPNLIGKRYSGPGGRAYGKYAPNSHNSMHDDKGSAARFFYCAKSSKKERGENNRHPTVKPLALMRYLCRLVTPPDGTVLDPFMGSGSTGVAAIQEGFEFIGCDIESEYVEIAKKRIEAAQAEDIQLTMGV